MMRLISKISLAVALVIGVSAAQAAIVFDFESTANTATDASRPGALTSLALSNSGLTMTITRPGSVFDVMLNTGGQSGKPVGWGLNSLDPFAAQLSATPFILDFSSAVTSVSVQFGDYGADFPDILTLQAYAGPGGTGSLLATDSVQYTAANFPAFATGLVSASGIMSVVMIGGTAGFPNSVFYDNITVPEPGTLALLGLGLAGLGVSRRRKQ